MRRKEHRARRTASLWFAYRARERWVADKVRDLGDADNKHETRKLYMVLKSMGLGGGYETDSKGVQS